MSEVFKAIEKAKQYCLDHMDLNNIYIHTYAPSHRFDDRAFVEEVVQKIDDIAESMMYVKDGSARSEAAKRLRNLAYNSWISTDMKKELYTIANIMDNEFALAKESTENDFMPFHICEPLLAFLDSYYQNGGAISKQVLDKIMEYCSDIETNYQRMINHEKEMYVDYLELKEAVEKILE